MKTYLKACPTCAGVLTNSLHADDITFSQKTFDRSLKALTELDHPDYVGLAETDTKKYQHCEICHTDFTANYFHTITSGHDEILNVCAYCNTVKDLKTGKAVRPATEKELTCSNVSHGICTSCLEKQLKELENDK